MKFVAIFFTLGLSIVSQSSLAAEATDLLKKMEKAIHSLNYQGRFTYLYNNHMESMQVTHRVKNGIEFERLISLNGAPREVVKNNKEVICVQPENKSVSVEKRNHSNPISMSGLDPKAIDQVYNLSLEKGKRIAGFNAISIKILPKDEFRYGHIIYLDSQYYLPLRSDLIDTDGTMISQIMFTSLNINPLIDDSETAIQNQQEVIDFDWSYQEPMQDMDVAKGGDWTFSMLPRGFKIKTHARRIATEKNTQTDHFVFSDGLGSLSIYIEKPSDKIISGSNQIGPINVFGQKIQNFQVTAVGEVPQATVKAVVQSMSYIEGDAK